MKGVPVMKKSFFVSLLVLVFFCFPAFASFAIPLQSDYVENVVNSFFDSDIALSSSMEEYTPDDPECAVYAKSVDFEKYPASFHVLYNDAGEPVRYQAQFKAVPENTDIVLPIINTMILYSLPSPDEKMASSISKEIISSMSDGLSTSGSFDHSYSVVNGDIMYTLRQDYTSFDLGGSLIEWYFLIFDVDPSPDYSSVVDLLTP
ncbi:MAG: hypothetical protein GX418_12030 [Clostridiales bacterium]|nr:hypothetical protein [Clostridiales bacterium]